MRLLLGRLLGVVLMSSCGSGDFSARDAAPPDAPPISLAPYFQACTRSPDSCAAPYVCTTTTPRHAGVPVEEVCLIPCSSNAQCPESCFCEGVGGHSDSSVPDNHCTCV